jgi:hypothetical protein
MPEPFVPESFEVPPRYEAGGFRLEPLGPEHNERDHEAWMSSIEHIHGTPGMESWEWPQPMTLAENLADMEMHAGEFVERSSFTYSILAGDEVIGCVYIYPDKSNEHDAVVRSWVRESRAEMDPVVWSALSEWLEESWPFQSFVYAPRG